MTDLHTMVRTSTTLDGITYFLAQHQDLDDLKRRIEEAVHVAGRFVDFIVVGNRVVSALITPSTSAVFTVETVEFDARDTGDGDDPYGGTYDL